MFSIQKSDFEFIEKFATLPDVSVPKVYLLQKFSPRDFRL